MLEEENLKTIVHFDKLRYQKISDLVQILSTILGERNKSFYFSKEFLINISEYRRSIKIYDDYVQISDSKANLGRLDHNGHLRDYFICPCCHRSGYAEDIIRNNEDC